MKLAHTIKQLRTTRGLSQAELAAKIKVTQAAISQLEQGRTTPRLATLQRIAKAMKISIALLLS
jgi:transcriptional regulator with XRE-family HTH domain